MKNKERLIGVIMSVIISVAMGAMFTFLSRRNWTPEQAKMMPPAAVNYILSIVESVAVGLVIALVIPIAKLGKRLAEACKAKPPSIKFNLINGIPFTVINSCLLGTIMSGLGIFQARRQMPMEVLIKQPPFVKVWLGSCLENLPIAIIVSYILAIIISPLVVKAVGLGGPPPENRKPEN